MKISDVSRKQAFLSHLLASTSIFLILSYLIIFQWYPSFYFELDGGRLGIVTIFFVDIVLGPGLTLLVFKPNKKSLKFDMSVVLLCQILALGWGVKSVYEDRPALTVFYLGKFSCLTQSDVGEVDRGNISKGSAGKQMLAFLRSPDLKIEKLAFQYEALKNNSAEIYYYGSKFESLNDDNVDRILRYKLDLEALKSKSTQAYNALIAYKKKHAESLESYHFYPISSRFKNAIAVFDSRQMKIVDIINAGTSLRATLEVASKSGL